MKMCVDILLNKRSRKLIKHHINSYPAQENQPKKSKTSADFDQLIRWLTDGISLPKTIEQGSDEYEFTIASLYAELLDDVGNALALKADVPQESGKKESKWNTLKFIVLTIAGTLLAACEGFDSITSILSLLTIPSIAILIAGIIFSIASIVIFYCYNLMQISQALGVSVRSGPQLLDVYLQQLQAIKKLKKAIDAYQLATLSLDELHKLERLVVMLQIRLQDLSKAQDVLDNALNSKTVKGFKYIITGLAGLLFFGSGFFSGQSVAMYIAGFFMPTVSPVFWPVLLFGIVIGIAAFALYWYLERDGLDNLIGGWFGLDQDKIEPLCNQDKREKLGNHFVLLKQKIISTSVLIKNLDDVQTQLRKQPKEALSDHDVPKVPKVSNNSFAFHAQARDKLDRSAVEYETMMLQLK